MGKLMEKNLPPVTGLEMSPQHTNFVGRKYPHGVNLCDPEIWCNKVIFHHWHPLICCLQWG
jgi:hypothetical protein